jgi:RNA polymerase sigma-70 factor (ECF subfamily)
MVQKDDRKERALLKASIEGDSEAFEALNLKHMERIYRYIFFRVADQAQAEDMTEEVFIRAWEALPKYEVGKHPFSSWLYRIAHNLLVDHYRRKNPTSISTDELLRFSDPTQLPEKIVGHMEENEALAKSIMQLDDVEQQVLLLRFVEGLSHREIGSIIGKSATASRVIQHRALKALRAILRRKGFANV